MEYGCCMPIKRNDCYFYYEEPSMGAHIPICKLHFKLGYCPCENCKDYISEAEAFTRVITTVEHGRWASEDLLPKHWRVCDKCGYVAKQNYQKYKYCPNCGRKMSGDTE